MNKLTIKLTPKWGLFQQMETVCCLQVDEWLEYDEQPNQNTQTVPAFCFPDIAFGGRCPFPEWEYLHLDDASGKLNCQIQPIPTLDDNMTFQGLFTDRHPEGTIHLSYNLLPRILPEGYRRSPCFDFRAEPSGLTGTGLFSLILPFSEDKTEKMDVSLFWDLSKMPEGSRAILSLGEGNLHQNLTRKQLADTMFSVGRMQAFEQDGLGVYWFLDPPFDIRALAERILPIFKYEKAYFHDPSASFRVFLRRDPFRLSGAGSACPYAFISTYSQMDTPEDFAGRLDDFVDVFIHEMTHTWPSMEDQKTGDGTWFCEGATEFYCTMLPYWGGFVSADETSRKIHHKINEQYLNNPYRETSNEEISKIQWQDLRAQHVPYGRGMLYVAMTEYKLKKAGKGSILELVSQHNIVSPMTLQEWKDFVFEKLGKEGLENYKKMEEGKIPSPIPDDLFGQDIQTDFSIPAFHI